ncbi:MAG: hypothetical protein SF052_06225 [Bacteroidia bacterium]|nr:hypothetical protein [Bacteroidia bacterium]
MVRALTTIALVIFGIHFYGQDRSVSDITPNIIILGTSAENKPEPSSAFFAQVERQISDLNQAISEYQIKRDSLYADPHLSAEIKTQETELCTQIIEQAQQMIQTNRRILEGKVVILTSEN